MRGSRSRGCHERPAFRVIRSPELVGRAEKREPALQHEPDAAAEQQALAHVVGHEDHAFAERSEEHTSELQSQSNLVCRLLLGQKNIAPIDELTCAFTFSSWRETNPFWLRLRLPAFSARNLFSSSAVRIHAGAGFACGSAVLRH